MLSMLRSLPLLLLLKASHLIRVITLTRIACFRIYLSLSVKWLRQNGQRHRSLERIKRKVLYYLRLNDY